VNKSTTTNSDIGFPGLLTCIFITLKLCHVIDWSWWWVWSPILILVALYLVIATVCLLFGILAALLK
jgi:hypothetical protein